MKKYIKKIATVILITGLSVIGTTTAFAGQWKQDSTGWWWQEDDGSWPSNVWRAISGKWYYFGNDGYMLSNTTTPDGYKVGADGAWVDGNVSGNLKADVNALNTIVVDMRLTMGELQKKYGDYELGKDIENEWYYSVDQYTNEFLYYDGGEMLTYIEDNSGILDELYEDYINNKGAVFGKEVFFTNSPIKVDSGRIKGAEYCPNYSFLVDEEKKIPGDAKPLLIEANFGKLFPGLDSDYEMDDLIELLEDLGATNIDGGSYSNTRNLGPWYGNKIGTIVSSKVKFEYGGCHFYTGINNGNENIPAYETVYVYPCAKGSLEEDW